MELAPDIHGDFGVPWIYINTISNIRIQPKTRLQQQLTKYSFE